MTSTPIPISTKPSSRSVFFPDFPARKVRAAPPIAVLRGKQESPAKAARHVSSALTGRLLFIDSHNHAKFLQKTPFTACPQEKSASTRFRAPRHTPSVFRLFGNIAGQTTGKTAPEISGRPRSSSFDHAFPAEEEAVRMRSLIPCAPAGLFSQASRRMPPSAPFADAVRLGPIDLLPGAFPVGLVPGLEQTAAHDGVCAVAGTQRVHGRIKPVPPALVLFRLPG